MSSNNGASGSSTFQSYVDSAVGAAQSAMASVTGNTADQVCDHSPLPESCAETNDMQQNQADNTMGFATLKNKAG